MSKNSRLNVRLREGDASLLRAAAKRLEMSVSELVRRASVVAAVKALGVHPPPDIKDQENQTKGIVL